MHAATVIASQNISMYAVINGKPSLNPEEKYIIHMMINIIFMREIVFASGVSFALPCSFMCYFCPLSTTT